MARSVQSVRPEVCRIDVHPDGRIRRMDSAARRLWDLEHTPDRVQDLWVDGDATTLVPAPPVRARLADGSERSVDVRVIAQGDGISIQVAPADDLDVDELRDRANQLEEAQRMSSLGSWSWDIKQDVVEWSDELYRLYGVEPEAFEANYEAFINGGHPDDRGMVNETVQNAFQTGSPWHFEHRLVQPDGTVRWLQALGAVVMENGEPVRMYGTAQDITDSKALAESETLRRTWFEKSIDLLCVTDGEGHFIELNPAWERTLGYPLEELLGHPFIDFVHPDDRESSMEEAGRLWTLKGHETVAFQNRYRHKDGSYRTLRWTSGVDQTSGNLYAVARDVTQEQREQRRFEQLLESAPDGMVIVGARGVIQFANAQTESMFGYRRDELVGKTIETLIPERFRQSHETHRGNFMEAPRTRPMGAQLDLFARRKDGSEFPVEISLSPIESEEGTIVTAAIRDVTDRKEGEEARRLAYEQQVAIEQLEKSNQARIQLLNTVAHELNTPLTPIRLQMKVLQRLIDRDQDVPQRTMDIIRRNLERLSILVKDILDAARMDSGRLRLRPDDMDMEKVVREAVSSFEDLAAKEGVRLDVSVSGSTRLRGDASRLTQVLFNLVSNAIKFTPKEGAVHVVVAGEDDRVVVHVDDDGEGFEPELGDRLFQPFSQLHDTTGPDSGTGLGLYICRGIVEEHGGRIRGVSPGPGLGASFRFWVPRHPQGDKGD